MCVNTALCCLFVCLFVCRTVYLLNIVSHRDMMAPWRVLIQAVVVVMYTVNVVRVDISVCDFCWAQPVAVTSERCQLNWPFLFCCRYSSVLMLLTNGYVAFKHVCGLCTTNIMGDPGPWVACWTCFQFLRLRHCVSGIASANEA